MVASLECAMTGSAGDRVAMWIDGINVADITVPDAFGPFTNAGLYGEGYEKGFRVAFDDVVAAIGGAYRPVVRAPQGPSLDGGERTGASPSPETVASSPEAVAPSPPVPGPSVEPAATANAPEA